MDTADNRFDIVIIGAGMAGLNAAVELLAAGKKVAIVEARDRIGGRINTIHYQFSQPVDAGAEFIHGRPPLTLKLAKAAGCKTFKKEGKVYRNEGSGIHTVKDLFEDRKKVVKALRKLDKDMPLSEFIENTFNKPEDERTRESIIRMAEGFDVADVNKISAFSVRDEWKGDSADTPLLIQDGYGSLIAFLHEKCLAAGCKIYTMCPVTGIIWDKDLVKIRCGEQKYLEASQALITLPLGVLTAGAHERNYIRFVPPLHEKIDAAKKIGFGKVVKLIVEFKTAFWNQPDFKEKNAQVGKLGFLMDEGAFPIWWTQSPKVPLLTGWAGGPNADALGDDSTTAIFEKGMGCLARALLTDPAFLKEQLVSYRVVNWGNDDFAKGAYSYETPETAAAREVLNQPVEQVLFFCGEALDDSGHMGTVEAAISSAQETVKKILNK